MKKLILATTVAATVLLSSFSVQAGVKISEENCVAFGKSAIETMTYRQNGATIFEMLDFINSVDASEDSKEIARKTVRSAYDHYLATTDDWKQQVITEFSTTIYLDCVNGVGVFR